VLATPPRWVGGFRFRGDHLAAGPLGIALASGLFGSTGEARRAIQGGGLSINDERPDPGSVDAPEPIAGEWLVVRFGKRRLAVGRRSG
jgi:tyrosyl-tRNA synthetase